jgi:hypothetical protein
MMKHLPLERLYRDSRCGSLTLPWTAEQVLDRMGRETLYQPGERDDRTAAAGWRTSSPRVGRGLA